MDVAIHWQDADSSSAKAVREIFPTAEIMLCGGHVGRAHRKTPEATISPCFPSHTYVYTYMREYYVCRETQEWMWVSY